MIEFIEKEPFNAGTPYITRTRVPVFMVKDGKEFFVANRLISDSEQGGWGEIHIKRSRMDIERHKAHLLKTDGKFFKFYGGFDDPLDLIQEIRERGYTFMYENFGTLIKHSHSSDSEQYMDFGGNLKEFAFAFRYRIYDKEIADRICSAVVEILKGGKRT